MNIVIFLIFQTIQVELQQSRNDIQRKQALIEEAINEIDYYEKTESHSILKLFDTLDKSVQTDLDEIEDDYEEFPQVCILAWIIDEHNIL